MDKKIIEEIFEKVKKEKTGGALASYIPELKAQNPDDFGVSIVGDNFSYEIGNSRNPFTVQSVSKVVILALALDENTFEEVEDKISFEPSSNPFNSIKDLEIKNANRPLNPFINAGAIATTSLIKGSYNEKFEKIVNLFEKLSGEEIKLNEKVFRSEKKTGDRNRALAYYMKSTSILDLDENIEKLLDVYFKTCSLSVNSYILSKIGYVLSHSGFNQSGEKILSSKLVKTLVATMALCGMYDESGKTSIQIGIPSKSGVGGGVLSVVPNKYGIGLYSPLLNEKGSSIKSFEFLKELSGKFDLSIY